MELTVGRRIGISTGLFVLVAVIPFTILGIMAVNTAQESFIQDKFEQLLSIREIKKGQIENYFEERQGDMGVLVETVSTLRKEAFDKLAAVRQVKRAAVERYFQTIENQIVTFSRDRMVVDAMREYRNDFRRFRKENGLSAADVDRMRRELRTYYNDDFSNEYQKQNSGRSPDIDTYFKMLDDDSIALQYYYIKTNSNPLGSKHLLDRADDGSRYSQLHGDIHPIIRDYLTRFGYYDIFLVDPDTGDIVYTVFKELDFSTSLIDGPNADTNFGEAFRRANAAGNRDTVVLVDYDSYLPSYEAPASFIASPIFDGDEKIGIAMFQMPIDRLNTIMNERAGLGDTGETYLVGPDKLMRSDSYLDPERHSVIASFRHPEKGKVETVAAAAALSGKTGAEVIIDYNGNPVLSAYTPVDIGDFTWGLLAEIDVAEAFCPKDKNGTYFFEKYKEMYGYYDLFLINPDGYCFYTVAKEADYQTNLVNGKYAGSGLGKLVQKVLQTKQFGMADFEPYAPSNNEPAAFIAQPEVQDNQAELVVALQIPLDAINSIMQEREGLGQTGETYLVGTDKLMRSDSYLDPENHSVVASFADPETGGVDTDASQAALAGESGTDIVIDYNGNPVLSAYTPVAVGDGISWGLLAEIDEKEVVSESAAAKALLSRVWGIGITAGIIILLVSLFNITGSRNLVRILKRIIGGLGNGSEEVVAASGQVSAASQSLAEGASEQAASIEETSAALEEMTAMTRQNVDNAGQADTLMKSAGEIIVHANSSMGELTGSMDEISRASQETSKIVKTIDEISFQTNLLALNAAVEAARAGEAGAGFAVVADEVRNLAMRAAEAAKETAVLIDGTVKKVEAGAGLVVRTDQAFREVAESVQKVGELVAEIAAASGEQSKGIDQIHAAIMGMDKVVQGNAANAEENAAASEELNSQAESMKGHVFELVALVDGKKNGYMPETNLLEMEANEGFQPASLKLQTIPGMFSVENKIKQLSRANRALEVDPTEILPLEDQGFEGAIEQTPFQGQQKEAVGG